MKEFIHPQMDYLINFKELNNLEFKQLSNESQLKYINEMKKLVEEQQYKANSEYLLREVADEYMLVPLADAEAFSGSMLLLNGTCAFLWKQFLTSHTISEVIDIALIRYDGERIQIEKEVQEFVRAYL